MGKNCLKKFRCKVIKILSKLLSCIGFLHKVVQKIDFFSVFRFLNFRFL